MGEDRGDVGWAAWWRGAVLDLKVEVEKLARGEGVANAKLRQLKNDVQERSAVGWRDQAFVLHDAAAVAVCDAGTYQSMIEGEREREREERGGGEKREGERERERGREVR